MSKNSPVCMIHTTRCESRAGRTILCYHAYARGKLAMLLKLAVACTVVALSVSPCLGQNSGSPDVDPNRDSLSATVRRAWQTDAKELAEMVIAKHPQGATRCSRKVNISESIECFQRLVERHFLSQVPADSSQMRSWCLDDANPRRCLESMAAQEVELWRHNNRKMVPSPAQAESSPVVSR